MIHISVIYHVVRVFQRHICHSKNLCSQQHFWSQQVKWTICKNFILYVKKLDTHSYHGKGNFQKKYDLYWRRWWWCRYDIMVTGKLFPVYVCSLDNTVRRRLGNGISKHFCFWWASNTGIIIRSFPDSYFSIRTEQSKFLLSLTIFSIREF